MKLFACHGNRLSRRFLANGPEAWLIVAFKGPTLVDRSRLVKAIVILFTEHFYSVYRIIPRYSLLSHMCADPAFSLRFLECGFSRVLDAFRPSYPPSVVPRAWDSGCARISFPSPRFPGYLVALTLRSNLRAVSSVM